MTAFPFTLPLNSELFPNIKISPASPYLYYTLYELHLPGLQQGDIVQASGQCAATNNYNKNVMFAHALVLRPAAVTINPQGTRPTGLVLPCDYAGENITPGNHHTVRSFSGVKVIDAAGDWWLSLIGYAASSAASADWKLKIDKGGSLCAVVLRND